MAQSFEAPTEFYKWLQTCPVHVDYSHEIKNKNDTQVYYYFIFDKENSQ